MSVTLISVSQDTVVSNKHEERTRHYYVIFQHILLVVTSLPLSHCCVLTVMWVRRCVVAVVPCARWVRMSGADSELSRDVFSYSIADDDHSVLVIPTSTMPSPSSPPLLLHHCCQLSHHTRTITGTTTRSQCVYNRTHCWLTMSSPVVLRAESHLAAAVAMPHQSGPTSDCLPLWTISPLIVLSTPMTACLTRSH